MRNHAGIRDNQQMGWEEFNARAPDILLDALSTIHAPSFDGDVELFDAVIVDEAQDFEETWWVPLPDLLKDPDEGILYVFFDDNQRIYTQLAEMPIDMAMFSLHRNCRNTQHIHQVMAPYAVASETQCIGPPGRPIDVIPTQSGKAAADALRRVLHAIVDQEGVDPKDIVILTPRSDRSSQWKQDTQLGKFALTWDMDLHGDLPNMIEVCSIYGFKGLERAVVILTELDQARDDIMHQLVYVGLSRARHHVVVLGDLPVANGEEASHG
jgi:hypothetical protein